MKSCLYTGRVSHSRFAPRPHSFSYGISMALVSLAELEGGGRGLLPGPWWRRLLRLRPADHLRGIQGGEGTLAQRLALLVRQRLGLDIGGEVFLLTGFGFLWHRFNPVSVYYCHGADGTLQCLVAEVTNTPWNEQSCYVLDARDQVNQDLLRFDCAKNFHVSPFMPMDTRYRWRLSRPAEDLLFTIAVERREEPLFSATLNLQRRPLAARHLFRALARQPLMSLSVVLRIYWQALRLWLKATPLFAHPGYSSGDKP